MSLVFISFEFVSCFVLRISDLNRCASGLALFQGASLGLPLSERNAHFWPIRSHGIGSQLANRGNHILDCFCKTSSLGSRDIHHSQTLTFQSAFRQKFTGIIYPAFGHEIALNKMTAAFFTTGHENAVSPIFKSLHKIFDLEFARTGCSNDPNIRRILKTHGTGQVRGCISAIMTAKGYNFRFI